MNSHEYFALNLRKAANLIGFVLFPVGWLWIEYRRAKDEALTDIERKAQELGSLGIPDKPDDRVNMGNAINAIRAGMAFRRLAVEELLRRLIYRGEIPVIVTESTGLRGRLPDHARFDPSLSFLVEANAIRVRRNEKWVTWKFETDGIDLTNALNGRLPWAKKNVSPNDWFKLERFLRELFERKGILSTREAYVEAAQEWWAQENPSADELPINSLRERVSDLYAEYSFSKKVASKK